MVRLMEIQELPTVLEMWKVINKEAHPFIGEDYWDNQDETMIQTFGNANVYVYVEHDVIKGFAFVVEGYYLGGVFVEDKARRRKFGTELVNFIKSRYDELVINIYDENKSAQSFITSLGFSKEETEIEEATGVSETTYAWFE